MASQAACYVKLNNTVSQAGGWSSCGLLNATISTTSCCQNGDYCLSNGLCQYTRSQSGGSGFYVAGCTDGTYNAASCPQLCNDLGVKDATFQQNPTQVWKCCGASTDGNPNCDKPTNENFNAPKPDRLDTTYQASVGTVTAQSNPKGPGGNGGPPPPTSTSISSTSSGTPQPLPTITVTSSPTRVASYSRSHRLSSAAAGGIGAAGAAALLLIGALLFLLYRRKRSPVSGAQPPPDSARDPSYSSSAHPTEDVQRYDSARNRSHEMLSPWTPGASVPAYYDRKEFQGESRPINELYAEHAVEMSNDGMITPVPTRVLGHEMSTESIRPTVADGKGKGAWA